MGRPRALRASVAALAVTVLPLAVGACSTGGDDQTDDGRPVTTTIPPSPVREERTDALPAVTPTPQQMRWIGPDVPLPPGDRVDLRLADGVDRPTRAALDGVLTGGDGGEAGGRRGRDDDRDGQGGGSRRNGRAELTVRIGPSDDPDVAEALAAVGLDVPTPLPAEGYALAAFADTAGRGTVAIAADDGAGGFYAVQTLRQLVTGGEIAGVGVVDRPAMAIRGVIEGFYGRPWTPEERLDQLAFYGRYKLNTYVYAPKEDPYHRDRWREPYPPAEMDGLRALVEAAAANHVTFTFAVSPGTSVCYSNPADVDALVAKLTALYDLGVRSFSIALDDIDHERWNCDGDTAALGPPSAEAAARAQAGLLAAVQERFVAAREGVAPLQMVPTEYRRTNDSPYRSVLRQQVPPEVLIMWTGTLVVPAEITVDQAAAAARVFGRPTLVWDNTPVNDFPPTEGRLLLGPYTRRQAGLSAQVAGIVLNPMNQAAASKVALLGAADFAWNDAAYDPARAHRAAAELLAGGDRATVQALLAFFDVETLAPTSGDGVSQPQAPVLAARLDDFRAAWRAGDRAGAVAGLRPYAERLAGAPERIRAHVVDPAFVADCGPWLDATALWGRALVATLDALDDRLAGDEPAARAQVHRADQLVAQARAITTIPGETRPQGPVRVADGVLDTFLTEARTLR